MTYHYFMNNVIEKKIMKKWAIVDNTLTAIKTEIRRLRLLGFTVTEVTIFAGCIEYVE